MGSSADVVRPTLLYSAVCIFYFLIDLLVVLVTTESGIPKPPIGIVELSISPCIPVSFASFTKFGVLLLGTYVFIIVTYVYS